MTGRNQSLDVLRAVAVLAVLVFHQGLPWTRNGWMGVDLFFVLSGYLVSGLLFDELARSGAVRPGRFLVRRAFKIYPAFWLLLVVTVACFSTVDHRALVCELLFVQNYGPGLWAHTWSLAVEEHFYLLVALAFFWRAAFARLTSTRRRVGAFVAGLVLVLASRVLTVWLVPAQYKLVVLGTHVRIDALLCGVAIAWALREPELGPRLRAFVVAHRVALLLVAFVALLPFFWFEQTHWFTRTIGFSLIWLACGALLLVALSIDLHDPVSRTLARIGRSSYSIYLWHMPVSFALGSLVASGTVAKWASAPAIAIGLGIVVGIAGTHLVEAPFLRLRDRLVARPAGTS